MVYTLIVLSVLLVISFAIISVNQSQTRNAITTDESVVAFFLAESGAEIILERIYSGTYNAGSLSSLSPGTCNNGILMSNLDSGVWTATFYDSEGTIMNSCSDTSWRQNVDEIKVDGNHSNTIRSIRMSIKPL